MAFDPTRGAERLGLAAERIERGVRAVRSRLPGARPDVVVVELRGSFPERAERQRLFGLPLPLGPAEPSLEWLRETAAALARAPFLRAIVLDLSGFAAPAAAAYSVRLALEPLARAGKRVIAFTPRLDWLTLYVASAAAEIAAPESADVGLHGFGVGTAYFGDVLRRAGLRLEKVAVGGYKSAFDEWIRGSMSDEQREQIGALLDGFEDHFARAVAAARGLSPREVRLAVDAGVSSAHAAKDAALIDRIAYLDQLAPRAARLSEVASSLPPAPAPAAGPRVAVLPVDGVLVPGRSRRSPARALAGRVAGAESLVRALRGLRERDDLAAVVLHVSSPGGSALASDLVHREVERLAAEKPVIAALGSVAASGGYYVAVGARRVVATPLTVTGSIGVFTAKLSAEDALGRHGVRVETVERGRFALTMSPLRSLREDERALLQRQAEDVYDRFLERVSRGRKRGRAEIEALARGRVWAGDHARERGLVDELGDLPRAISLARDAAGLPSDAGVAHVQDPEPPFTPALELAAQSLQGRALGALGPDAALVALWPELGGGPLALSRAAWLAAEAATGGP